MVNSFSLVKFEPYNLILPKLRVVLEKPNAKLSGVVELGPIWKTFLSSSPTPEQNKLVFVQGILKGEVLLYH
jgi:hypothetical protein